MWLYNIALALYAFVIKIASLWIPKAKLWCEGRQNIFQRMAQVIAPEDRILWIHVASLGEFEQGRPLIEKFKAERPEYKILLTFYSPSGYELRKGYKGADYIFYLPVDTPRNVRKFLDVAHPEIAIFVKYEFWLNMLFSLAKRGVKTYIVSAIFRQDSIFFRSYGSLWRKALECFEIIFVQNEESKSRLSEIGFENVVVAGDTRFDRVAEIAKNAKRNKIVERFQGSTPLFVAGSSWPMDEELLLKLVAENRDIKFVIAPHEIEKPRIDELVAKLPGSVTYTQAQEDEIDEEDKKGEMREKGEKGEKLEDKQVLILDTMGQLSSIYHYASWAYIGGGFGVGIHNTLEASTFGLPIAFGPNYHKFKEAKDMISLGACHSVSEYRELEGWFLQLKDKGTEYDKVSRLTRDYTQSHQGATNIISENITNKKY